MITNNKNYIILLIIDLILLSIGIYNQDLYYNNYSYYATFIKGYIYLLIIAFISGLLMAYISNKLSNKKVSYIAFFSFIISSIIPSTINQATIIANIHILFAYLGFGLSILFNLINLYYYHIYNPKEAKKFIIIFMFIIFISLYFFLDKMMVNFISEYIYTTGILINNTYLFFNKVKKKM